MASTFTKARRHRSSTGASRGLSTTEQSTDTAILIRDLILPPFASASAQELEHVRLSEAAIRLREQFSTTTPSRDTFRHGGGFESILALMQDLHDPEHIEETLSNSPRALVDLLSNLLLVLREAFHDHRGNQRYFLSFLQGWKRLETILSTFQETFVKVLSSPRESLAPLHQGLLTVASGVGDSTTTNSTDSNDDVETSGAPVVTSGPLQCPQAGVVATHLALQLIKGRDEPDPLIQLSISTLDSCRLWAKSSTRNAVLLCQSGLFSSLLPLLLEDHRLASLDPVLEDLISSLATFGLTSLNDVATIFQRACSSSRAQTLLLQILPKSKAPSHIQFDMTLLGYSSIEFSSLPRAFPPTQGYTLTAWVRIDECDPSCHTTLFGAFDSSQSCFLLLYLEQDSHQLILQTSVRSARPSVRFKSTRFEPGTWFHVALVHRKLLSDPRHSPAMLFINGEFSEQVKVSYPESPPDYEDQQSPLTPASPHAARRVKPVQAFFGTPRDLALNIGPNQTQSKWSLASAHLYQAPLTDEFIAVHHRLGSRYSGNLQDCLGPLLTYRASAELNRYNELLHPDKADASDIVTATESRGADVMSENRLLLSISPLTVFAFDSTTEPSVTLAYPLDPKANARYDLLAQTTRAIAINGAIPSVNDAISRSYGTGILTGDPVVAISKAVDDASWFLAGSVPLLIRILEAATTRQAFLDAVKIYIECVRDNWRISEAMEKGDGFGMFAVVIRDKLGFENGSSGHAAVRRASPTLSVQDREGLSAEILSLILEFVGYDKDRPDASMIVNPMAYRVLLVDFDTWRRCDSETQNLYYNQFVHFAVGNIHHAFNQKRLMRMRVVRKFIEALKMEEIIVESIPSFMEALKALLEGAGGWHLYRDLAMFVAFGLQDARSTAARSVRSIASTVAIRQHAAHWARNVRASRPTTPRGQLPDLKPCASRFDLAVHVLELLTAIICDEKNPFATRRFYDPKKGVPNRWLLHLLAESDISVIRPTLHIICRSLHALGPDFKTPFIDKNGGFVTLKSRMKMFWKFPSTWLTCFAIMFGLEQPPTLIEGDLSLFAMIEGLQVNDRLLVHHPETLPVIMTMLETGLRSITKDDQPVESEARLLKTIIQFLSELYSRSPAFRDFAIHSRFIQELLFVLYPVLVGSDRLSALTELQSEKDSLSFKGQEVQLRPHSNSLNARPPSIRSLSTEQIQRSPSPMANSLIQRPRRLSSFILVGSTTEQSSSPAQFNAFLAPPAREPLKIDTGNATVEALLEVAINIFIDMVCSRKDFQGVGLFLKVPPGFREHQAYFESYLLVHSLTQLWNHLQLNQSLLIQTKVLTNLSKYSQHMAEAVFEGWFIDGAQPVLDFTGKVLEYLQQPEIAAINDVRLCSHQVNAIRVVFLRVTLWRLSELDEEVNDKEAVAFLNQMNYWQTILFSSENQETTFIRLICFLLYMKLVSDVRDVRLAAARLWRTILVQKPTETATLLTFAMGSGHRHLATGFMGLISMEDDDFLNWVDENRKSLDPIFVEALNKPWDDFVNDENKRNDETAKARLVKRKEKLRLWQSEEASADDFLHRYDTSTSHWRSNVHAQERLKMQRFIQDHQENVSHLFVVFSTMQKALQQPCGLEPMTEGLKWRLDETEAANRMRMRTVPDTSDNKDVYQPKRKVAERHSGLRLALDTQVSRVGGDNILSALPTSPPVTSPNPLVEVNGSGPEREENGVAGTDSVTNSQLLEGGFEMVEDPNAGDDGMVEDKNRKIMTSLQRGDVCQQLYNTSRIIGLEACEGLLVVGKKCVYLQDNYFQRSDGEIVSVSQAPEDERDPYVQLISGKDVGARQTKHIIGDEGTKHWAWQEVLSVSKRRFLFRDVSVELFFTDGRSYLLTCMSSKVRDDLYSAIFARAPHLHSTAPIASEEGWRLDTLRNPEEGPRSIGSKFASVFNSAPSHAATKKWARGEMSNFQYLMLVNTMAGRTFNDLTQYPVFPWVIADYTSEELDLSDPRSFRDLSKPMGCQTPAREADYRERYQQFAEMGDKNAPAFHYGTHYSSAMIVTSYLIRLQPFVQSYLLLQGGNFDHADRLFDSIEKAWISASRETMSDVRELTPEFFYLPEFLSNVNGYDFGSKQGGGEVVNDVQLPRWAKGDAQIFIAKNREALESPHVSAQLHQWIDLIFGFKQRGESAVEATNVFQHLSYQGAKDLDTISDPVERLATIGIIHSFGQTPHQIFQRSHLPREVGLSTVARLDRSVEFLIRLPDSCLQAGEAIANLTFSPTAERLVFAGPSKLNLLPNCDRFVQWGFADHSIRFFSSNTKRLLGMYENTHVGPVSTATFADRKTLVTGGMDSTIAIWTVNIARDHVEIHPKTYLFGHRSSITILTASRVCSSLLSASSDGQVVLWSMNHLTCTRVLLPAGSPPIQVAGISNVTGHVFVCQGPDLLLFTLNGHLLVRQKICDHHDDVVSCGAFYEGAGNEWLERELIFTGHGRGVANVWSVTTLADGAWHLQLVKRMNHIDVRSEDGANIDTTITAIMPMANEVYTGDDQGRVWEWNHVQKQVGFKGR